ncbi:TonB-dependent receptor [Sphingobacterium sp. N143]|uniref:SusC/RagA family TonB-linked outer membrane protein n=1 Tax=Sphingobacterium sp. N143 TaxID=2746727 RepID=UPI002575CFEC|nr:TonB-dependent receptor [Sphingobacterium sp. N143]
MVKLNLTRKPFFVFLVLTLLSFQCLAGTINGVIKNSAGQRLAGVSILLKNGGSNFSAAASSAADGTFRFSDVPDGKGYELTFSYIGYQHYVESNVQVSATGATTLSIILEDQVNQLEDVVVIGYGKQKKSDLTGAIASLSSNELTKGGAVSNVGQALQGKASGVVVTQNSKAPGGSTSIRIRGTNSISGSNDPLYVIDGFPTNNGININPDDIASMDILKDASATAIYGSRGANGVIIITTKRGRTDQNNITYSGYVGTQKPVNPFSFLDGKQYMNLANALYKEIEGQENQEYAVYTKSQLESDVNTDWVKETMRNSILQNHNLQFSGGGEKTKVLTSVGYFDQKGILKTTDFNRISGRINVDQKINDFIRTGATLSAQREKSNMQVYDGNILNSNVLYSILTYDPTVPVYNADGSFGRPPGGQGDNPLANLMSRINDVQRDKLNGNIFVEVNPIKELTLRMNAGTEITHDQLGSYLTRDSYQGGIDDGVASQADYNETHNLIDFYATYTKVFQEKHNLSVMGGYSYEKYVRNNKGINVKGFSTDLLEYNNLGLASSITGVNSAKAENLVISFFGRVNYAYADKYLLTATLRRDGSSRFSPNHRWGTFPSAAFAWKINNEGFMQDQQLFSDLKFRLGYGQTGNDRVADYASYGLMDNGHYTFDGITNAGGVKQNPNYPENDQLKWESTTQYNMGLDFAFFKNRLAFTLDAYYKKTNDLLIRSILPYYTGYVSGQRNLGAMNNKGLEFSVTSKNMTGEFSWETKLNIAMNRNKVSSLGGEPEQLLTSSKPMGNVSEEAYSVIRVGESLGSLFGYQYLGVIQQDEHYAAQPNSKAGDPKFADINGDGTINSADRTIIGRGYPKLNFGMTNTFAYKNFDLTAFVYGNLGNDLLNMTRMNLEWKRTTAALDRWTPTNTNTDIPRNGFYYMNYGGYINDHFIENASFLRLRNLTLGYTVPLKTKAIQSIRVYGMAENLFTISNYTGWDPEVDTKGYENDALVKNRAGNNQSANAGVGLDFNSYPSMRSFTFGVSATF